MKFFNNEQKTIPQQKETIREDTKGEVGIVPSVWAHHDEKSSS